MLKQKLLSLGRSEIHLERLSNQMAELKENPIPSNVKKFTLPWTSEFFMAPVEGTAAQIAINIEEAATFEEAKRKLYLAFLKSDTLLNHEVEQKRVVNLREQCSLESFIQICGNHVDEDYKSVSQVIHRQSGCPPRALRAHAKGGTRRGHEAVRSHSRGLCERKEELRRNVSKQKEKHEKAIEEAAKLSGHEVLGRAFHNFVKKGRPGQTKMRSTTSIWSRSRCRSLRSRTSPRQNRWGVPWRRPGAQCEQGTRQRQHRTQGRKSRRQVRASELPQVAQRARQTRQRQVERQGRRNTGDSRLKAQREGPRQGGNGRGWRHRQKQRVQEWRQSLMVVKNTHHQNKKEVGVALFRLLRDTSSETLAWLCRENEVCDQIHVADGLKYSAAHPSPGLIPWPALLLLGTFSNKTRLRQKAEQD